MKNQKLKTIVCIGWLLGVFAVVLSQKSQIVISKNSEVESGIPKPDLKEVEKFHSLILNKFLTEPGFGSARISPTPPYSRHVESFYPKNGLEKTIVEDFEQNGWKVGLYLYGKRTEKEIKKGVEQDKFLIDYRLKQPIIITKNIKKREDLSKSVSILKKVKEAFSVFQESETTEEKNFEFEAGGWWYFAKPVRAVNESCVRCHTDYAVVKKLDKGKYQFRKRRVGDVNGVLVYAFQKMKK